MTAPGAQPHVAPVSADEGGPTTVFEQLWTPYRMAYIRGEGKPTGDHDCPFCLIPAMSDEDGLVVARGATVFAVLNLYPYNAGHLMVVPYRHVPDYTDIDEAETAEVAALTQTAMRVLRRVSHPTGFNLGMNQGATGGAGIAAHLHQHVVPRWGGDGNFLPIIAQTKAITQTLGEVRAQVAEAWPPRGDDAAPPEPVS